jgi:hypothetical protein
MSTAGEIRQSVVQPVSGIQLPRVGIEGLVAGAMEKARVLLLQQACYTTKIVRQSVQEYNHELCTIGGRCIDQNLSQFVKRGLYVRDCWPLVLLICAFTRGHDNPFVESIVSVNQS